MNFSEESIKEGGGYAEFLRALFCRILLQQEIANRFALRSLLKTKICALPHPESGFANECIQVRKNFGPA